MVPRFIYLFIYLFIINFRASPIWCLMTSRQQGLQTLAYCLLIMQKSWFFSSKIITWVLMRQILHYYLKIFTTFEEEQVHILIDFYIFF